jgi:flagellar biosynthesis protein FlhF
MQMQTFKAPTMKAALDQVKATMGFDAVILHTRTYQHRRWMGLRRSEVVEITAGRDLGAGKPRQAGGPRGNPAAAQDAGQGYGPGYQHRQAFSQPAGQRTQPRPPAEPPAVPGQKLLDHPGAGKAIIRVVTEEIADLKVLVTKLVNDNRQAQLPEIPAELLTHYLYLIENEVAAEIARDIVQTLKRELRPEMLAQEHYVREKLSEQIEKLMPVAAPIVRKNTPGPHVIALIGPTGVGKTTTLAKLAASLKLNQKYRVGLITLDTYRIAAIDQLKKYAEIIGAPVKVVSSADSLAEAMSAMRHFDFILIDTAGRSPNDVMKLNELRSLLTTISPDEVHLVLSSTSGQSCVDLAVRRFSEVRVDKIIFTKLDEAAHVGVVLNVIKNVKKSLSYITTGQNVPDDIEVGRGRVLAQRLLNPGGDGRGLSNERFEK